jgi:hypothetical protein
MKPVKPIIISGQLLWDKYKPRFNAHQTGTGAHKSKKVYNRKPKHRSEEW